MPLWLSSSKSWGGRAAVDFVGSYDKLASQLVLAAPAGMTSGAGEEALRRLAKRSAAPVLLVWAEDDPVAPFDAGLGAFQAALAPGRLTIMRRESGGHRVPGDAQALEAMARFCDVVTT